VRRLFQLLLWDNGVDRHKMHTNEPCVPDPFEIAIETFPDVFHILAQLAQIGREIVSCEIKSFVYLFGINAAVVGDLLFIINRVVKLSVVIT
jgi:hypothetical protein